jgi:hypothetical protein
MNSLTFSSFKIEPFNLLEGYISNFANNLDESKIKLNNTEDGFQIIGNDEINQTYSDLSNNIGLYNMLTQNQNDLIDNSGNLLYKKNLNFKETIPSLKDAVLEDSMNIMSYTNNIYAISGIAIAILLVGIIIKSR